MVHIRGQAQDYDHWAQLGNRGWSRQDVLPVFKRMERFEGGSHRAGIGTGSGRGPSPTW